MALRTSQFSVLVAVCRLLARCGSAEFGPFFQKPRSLSRRHSPRLLRHQVVPHKVTILDPVWLGTRTDCIPFPAIEC